MRVAGRVGAITAERRRGNGGAAPSDDENSRSDWHGQAQTECKLGPSASERMAGTPAATVFDGVGCEAGRRAAGYDLLNVIGIEPIKNVFIHVLRVRSGHMERAGNVPQLAVVVGIEAGN